MDDDRKPNQIQRVSPEQYVGMVAKLAARLIEADIRRPLSPSIALKYIPETPKYVEIAVKVADSIYREACKVQTAPL